MSTSTRVAQSIAIYGKRGTRVGLLRAAAAAQQEMAVWAAEQQQQQQRAERERFVSRP